MTKDRMKTKAKRSVELKRQRKEQPAGEVVDNVPSLGFALGSI